MKLTARKTARAVCIAALGIGVAVVGLPMITNGPAGADFGAGKAARYNKNLNGDFLLVGNTVLTCSTNDGDCDDDNTVNDDLNMVNNDPDGSGGRFNGSSGTLTIPSGSVVDAAFLYWGANLGTTRNSGSDYYCSDDHAKASNATATKSDANKVQLKVGAGAYATVTADTVYTQPAGGLGQSLPTGSNDDGLVYEGVADVTGRFGSVTAGSSVTVAVGDIQAMQGENCHAGWSLTVVYRFPSLNCLTGANDGAANRRNDYRNVAIYDGLIRQQDGASDTTTTLSGFLTAQPGPDDLRLGVVAWEGDQFLDEDQMKVKSNLSGSATTVDPAGPSGTSNFFDSGKQTAADHNADLDANPDSGATIQRGFVGGRGDGHGIDAKTQVVQVPGGTSSIDVTFTTDSDQYYPGQFALSSPLTCLLVVEKDQAVNGTAVPRDNATSPSPYVRPGDVITYTMPVRVAGDVDLADVTVTDDVPAGTTFVAGSIRVGTGQTPAAALAALAAGGTFAAGKVSADVGTLNNLTAGNCAAGEKCYAVVRFQVTVDAGVAPGTVLTNQAGATFTASGIPIKETSNPVTDRVGANLTISKSIAGAVAGDPSSFSFTVSCNGNQVAGSPVSLGNGQSATIGVPPGATCSVTEATNANFDVTVTGAIVTNGGSTTMSQDRSVAFTNTRRFGRIVVDKTTNAVAGDPVAAPTFQFAVACPGVAGYPRTLQITGSGTAETPADIPFGTNCTVTETGTPGWAQSGSQSVQPVDQATETVSFTNTRQTGSIIVNKSTVGGDGTFQFAIACDGTNWDVTRTVTTSGGSGQSAAVTGIPAGSSCTVTETPLAGWDNTASPAGAFTIAAGQQSVASFTNVRQTADLVVTKAVSGSYLVGVAGTFDYTISCGAAGTFTRSVTASSSTNGTATVTGLPVGTSCTVTETVPAGWSIDATVAGNTNPRQLTIAESGNGVTFTNRRDVGSITIAKRIDQGSGTFRFDLVCNGSPVPGSPFDITIDAPATSGQLVIPGVPTGSACTVDENPDGGSAGDFVQVTPAANGVVTFSSTGAAQTATFVNERRTGDLVIRKAFPPDSLGDPDRSFTFQWDCGPEPRSVALKAGQQHTVSDLPTGTSCTVTEIADPDYTTTVSPTGGAVKIVDGTSEVTFTNTRKSGTIQLRKRLVPASDPGRFDLDIDGGTAEAIGVGDGGETAAVEVPIGSHTIGEVVADGNAALISDYTVATVCRNTTNSTDVPVTADGAVVVDEGAAVECEITNTRKTGTLTLTKVVVDPVASDDAPSAFDLYAGDTLVVAGAVDGSSGSTSANTGPVTVSETGPDLARFDSQISCVDGQTPLGSSSGTSLTIALPASADVVCTFTNTRRTGTLEVRKAIDPVDDDGRFDLLVDGAVRATAVGHGGTTGPIVVAEGQHTFDEQAAEGSDLGDYRSAYSCVDESAEGGPAPLEANVVTVAAGSEVVCTITNTLLLGSIEVRKALSPANDPGRFDLVIDAATKAYGVGDGGTTGSVIVPTGTHLVLEAAAEGTDMADYASSLLCIETKSQSVVPAEGGQIEVGPGDMVVCTFTNSRQTGTLEIRKGLTPASDPGRFDLLIDGNAAASAVGDGGTTGAVTVAAGMHAVGEAAASGADLADYEVTLVCSDGEGGVPVVDGMVDVDAGAEVVCLLGNTRRTGTVTLVKEIVGGNGDDTFDLLVDDSVVVDEATDGSSGSVTVDTGTVTVSEAGTNLGAYSAFVSCVADDEELLADAVATSMQVTVTDGADITCTFTNTRRTGNLTLVKVVDDPFESGDSFDLLADDDIVVEAAVNGSAGSTSVDTGTVTVSETGSSLSDYTASIVCEDGLQPVGSGSGTSLEITVAPDADITCTFTNTRRAGTIEVRKVLSPAGDDGRFDLRIDGVTRAAGVGDGGTTGAVTVPEGSHTVAEAAAAGTAGGEYDATLRCVDTADGDTVVAVEDGAVQVADDAAVVCTFTNTRKPADLSVEKDPGASSVLPGGLATFTITVTNDGAGTAHDVVVNDPVPAGTAYVSSEGDVCDPDGTSCLLGDLAPGETFSFTITYRVDADPEVDVVHNEVTVTSPDDPESPGDDADIPIAGLAITKTGTPGTYAVVGDELTYTYVVTNTGGARLTGVTVTDDKIPAAGIDCNGDAAGNGQPLSLDPGDSVTCTATAAVTSDDIGNGSVDNVGTADSDQTPPVSDDWSIPLAAMTIDKVATSTGPYALGATISYTITVTNTGTATLHGVTVTEAGVGAVLDPGCAAGPGTGGVTLEPAATVACTATHSVTQADFDEGSYVNVARAGSDETPDVTDSVTVSTPDPAVDLAIVKQLTTTAGLVVGQRATYTLTVSNKGPATATGIAVTDTLPAGLVPVTTTSPGWTCTIAGSTVSCTTSSALLPGATLSPISIVVDVTAAAGASVTNTAVVSGADVDRDPSNNTSSVTSVVAAVLTNVQTTTTTAAVRVSPTIATRSTPLATTGGSSGLLVAVGALLLLVGVGLESGRRLRRRGE